LRVQEVTAAIALGSNLGDRRAVLGSAVRALGRVPETQVVAVSDAVETEPVGPVAQGMFLNAAALLRTRLAARMLMNELTRIEHEHGRDRAGGERWGPRTLDLDLLLYGDAVIDEPGLTLPHPRLHGRAFVLDPLVRLAPEMVVPTLGRSIRELHAALHGQGRAC
jgi:2-amino-4-hydroxy-6-hydroxymethyldihydropteridine diphosphokinase